MTEQPDRPVLEVTVAASADTVWTALRDPDLIRRWHGWEVAELAEEIRTIYLNGVTEDPVARTLEITGGDTFTLHDTPGGTTVRVTQAPRGSDPDWADYYDDITEGWWTFLQQLRFAVERHALAERRTIVLQGLLDTEAAGLGPLRAASGAYRVVAPTGDELHGTVWARRHSQVALTVAEWGDGLLVLADQPVNPHRPHGGTMVLLTTYGLDPDAVDALENRWGAWWEKHRAPDPLP
jgi:uncharacterized protein YndB with AHSA1/START domain